MNKRNYLELISKKREEISRLKKEISAINKKYISDNCLFKVGDIIKNFYSDGEDIKITEIEIEKDGTFSFHHYCICKANNHKIHCKVPEEHLSKKGIKVRNNNNNQK